MIKLRENIDKSATKRIQQNSEPGTLSVDSFPPVDQIHEIAIEDHTGTTSAVRVTSDVHSDAVEETDVYENLRTDLSEITEIFTILTDDQKKIIMHIYHLYVNNKTNNEEDVIEADNENPKIILQGPAGTGKSTVINFIEKLVTWEENKTSDSPQKMKVLKCAFTGKAASNIEGYTLNNMLSIPFYRTRNLKKGKLESKKDLLRNCIFFICDEISMVGQRLMNSVNMRLQQIFDNDKLYGDRFVLLVGDLYQIDPVRQQALYPNSELWKCCNFYELTKIIRQQDENFISTLNNFRDGQMTEENIQLLRSREIEDITQVPDSVIHIFYLNKPVDKYNTEKLDKSNEKEEIVNNIEDDNLIPSKLRVKIGIRYMITYNMDVGDGLANGTTGVVKGFDYNKDKNADIVWMEFHPNSIGKKARLDYFEKHRKPGFENFVPIYRSKMYVKLKADPTGRHILGNMFPLKAAEAITVHKSQGQTYHDGVCIHITNESQDRLRTDRSLQYVALTRVTKIEDLYILGKLNFSLTNTDKINRVEKELKRLRTERKLKLAYETFDDKKGDVIIYLNTGLTFKDHYQFIVSDKWYDNGSLLIFTETNTIESDKIEIPNFEICFRTDWTGTNLISERGIICYKKANKSLKVIGSIKDDENKINLKLLLFENYLYIITGGHGNFNIEEFKHEIHQLISSYIRDNKCIFFIGNINNSLNMSDVLDDFSFKTCKVLETNKKNQCDMVLTRNCDIQQENIGFYEYIPSCHKSLYVKLPQNVELLDNNGVAYSPNNELAENSQHVPGKQEGTSVGHDTASGGDAGVDGILVAPAIEADVNQNKRPISLSGNSTLLASTSKRTKVQSEVEVGATEIMAIIPVDYPTVKILAEHLSKIQGAILAHVVCAPDPLPRIMVDNIVRGALYISCQGEGASTWISSVIGQEEVAGLRLKVVHVRDLPEPVKMAWKTRVIGEQDTRLMLRVLQRYNPSLHTEQWEIIDTLMLDTSTRLTMLIDQESADFIKASDYKLFSGVDQSSFELLEV